jgi:hypothetical protein
LNTVAYLLSQFSVFGPLKYIRIYAKPVKEGQIPVSDHILAEVSFNNFHHAVEAFYGTNYGGNNNNEEEKEEEDGKKQFRQFTCAWWGAGRVSAEWDVKWALKVLLEHLELLLFAKSTA